MSLFALVWLGAAPHARANVLESHCFCRFTKADVGACNLRAVVQDAGAIATFNNFMPKKNERCSAACDAILAGKPDAELCLGLARNLSVPLPWSGAVRTCARVGARGDKAGASRVVACAASAVPPKLPEHYWRMTFADEFKGAPPNASPAEQACYARKPSCMEMYHSGAAECPDGRWGTQHLQHLNKCTWTVLHKTNAWTPDTTSYDTRQVEVRPDVDDGVLLLTARGVAPDGTYLPFDARRNREGRWVSKAPYKKPSQWRHAGQYDCVSTSWDQPSRVRCPFVAGGVVSQRFGESGGPAGFTQQFGRFELRARLAYSPVPGTSAMWMLPQKGGWPGGGEIDIVEHDKDADAPFQTFHTGTCTTDNKEALDDAACKRSGGKRFHIMKSGSTRTRDLKENRTPFWKGYHVYGVEWDANTIRFLLDGQVRNTIQNGEIKQGSEMDVPPGKRGERRWMPMIVPQRDFFFLLNMGINHFAKKYLWLFKVDKLPNPDNFVPAQMAIDYVRAYSQCTTVTDFCPQGGAFDARSGTCANGRGPAYRSPCEYKPHR